MLLKFHVLIANGIGEKFLVKRLPQKKESQ